MSLTGNAAAKRLLKGKLTAVPSGDSAYEIAVRHGFVGTEEEWLASMQGKSAYQYAKDGGYTGTEAEFAAKLASEEAASALTTYTEVDGVGSQQNEADWDNEIWTRWNSRLGQGMYTGYAPAPFKIGGQVFADGTIICANSGDRYKNRWGFHLYEGYSKDEYSRLTMLIDKHTYGDGKNMSEIYCYIGIGHTDAAYGGVRIGSDVEKHSFLFDRDTLTAYGLADFLAPICLNGINLSTDIDSTYKTVAAADAGYDPEFNADANNRSLQFIRLANAKDGTMFYDEGNKKIAVKIGGTWLWLTVETPPDGTYSAITGDSSGDGGDDSGNEGGGDTTTYTVTNSLTNVTNSNSSTSVTEGSAYTARLTADSGYELSNVVIAMGGVNITASAYSGGVITIPSVTGNIAIVADAVESSGGDSGNEGGDSGGDDSGETSTYTVTFNLSNVTSQNDAATIGEGETYVTTLVAADGYEMDESSVMVIMGDTVLVSGGVVADGWDSVIFQDGTLYIESVTGNITIVASSYGSEEAEVYNVNFTLTNVTASNAPTTATEGESFNTTLTANDGYEISEAAVNMGGVDITSSVYSNGVVTIPDVTGDIRITATAVLSSTQEEITVVWESGVIGGNGSNADRTDRIRTVSYLPSDVVSVEAKTGYLYTIVCYNEYGAVATPDGPDGTPTAYYSPSAGGLVSGATYVSDKLYLADVMANVGDYTRFRLIAKRADNDTMVASEGVNIVLYAESGSEGDSEGSSEGDSTANYTNLVTTALDYDLDGVFNGCGYKDGHYVSTSAPYYSATTDGSVVTGLIPYDIYGGVNGYDFQPATIYIKGITFDSSNSHNRMGVFVTNGQNTNGETAEKFIYSTVNAASLSAYFTIETLGNQYYKLTPIMVEETNRNKLASVWISAINVSHIVFSGNGDGADLIITFDEPIE